MPFRERFKQSIKDAKSDIKALLKSRGNYAEKDTTGPATPPTAQPHTAGPAVLDHAGTPGVSGRETPLPPQVPTSASVEPPNNHDSDANVHLRCSAYATDQIEGDNDGMAEPSKNAPETDCQRMRTALMVSTGQTSEPEVSDIGQESAPEPTYQGSIDKVSTEKGLKVFAKELVHSATDTLKFGPLKDVSDMLQGFADIYIMEGAVKKEYDALKHRLHRLLEVLEEHSDEGVSQTMQSQIQGIRDFIHGELNAIEIKRSKTSPRRLTMAKNQEDRFIACCQRIQEYMERQSVDTRLLVWKMEEKQLKDRMSSLVSNLPFSSPACYNSRAGEELKRRECTPGTRVDLLATLLAWTNNIINGGVYWINGMAGTGKTTIACSVCKALDARGNLAASFFCSRLREECRDVNRIIPSIAYQIARRFQPFQSALSAVLEKEPDMHTKRLEMQFRALIEEPLLSANTSLPGGLVVVIDALDECGDKDSTRDVLQVLLSQAAHLSLKFIVSSRPEPHVRDQMAGDRVDSRLILHELDTGSVKADIKTYLEDELKPMKPPPTEGQIAALVERAGILFIYAATAVRYIGFNNFKRNPGGRLHTILNGSHGSTTLENTEIDMLYSTILEAAFGEAGLEENEKIDMQRILHTVVCAREPLTVSVLSELLQIHDADRVRGALDPMWSVLHVVETSELVTTLHASFPDFMFDATRSLSYHCDRKAHNLQLTELCFERIKQARPQFNICEIDSSYLFDKEVPDIDEKIARAIPSELLYACRYWADHVEVGECASSVIAGIRDFVSRRLFLWLEVLNLKKQLRAAVECMRLTSRWCSEFERDPDLVELAHDARRFVDVLVSTPISRSTPHIYISMMAFWPRSSPMVKSYASFVRGPVEAAGTALGGRQLAHLSTWEFDSIEMMTISPDGSLIALGIGKEVVVVDSSNGRRLLEPLSGHPDAFKSIRFTPNGDRVLVGSSRHRNATIMVWDTRTGHTVFGPVQLRRHSDDITCLSFSPDCTHIITGAFDNTLRLWETETRKLVTSHTIQSRSFVSAAVFAPDGAQIIASLSDNTVHIWDTRVADTRLVRLTGIDRSHKVTFTLDGLRIASYHDSHMSVWDPQTGEKVLGPIEGHTAQTARIGCSPDGRYIVSGSADRTVRVWDAQTGTIVLGPLQAHTGGITSVAFTPDGSRIISACGGGLVCTWDAQWRSLPPSYSDPPFDPIRYVKFSSDGTRFVSGSGEGTISTWDAQTGEMRVGPIKAHTSQIKAVDFWNDRVVSGADDGTICVCDALTGEAVLGPLQLDAGAMYAVRYSPDGQMIATGSKKRVDVWNGQNGSRVLGPLTGLGREVVSVQFSPDGTRIVASSWASNSHIAVWDVSTGQNVFGTLDGHRDYVRSVSYSPNGALIASGSDDCTIIVWDAYTGKKRHGPLTAGSSLVLSVHFSPDSTRLVSGSLDRRIRIWDVETGEMVFELPNGHERGITSVEHSRDGTRILSLSDDRSVRIHDARSPAERALSRSESEVGDWTMDKDGWVVEDQSRLLVWVPGDLRKVLMWPRTQVIVAPQGHVRLKFDKSRLGESWANGFSCGM